MAVRISVIEIEALAGWGRDIKDGSGELLCCHMVPHV
jgi:hypothetical protein